MADGKLTLTISNDDEAVAYLTLPGHPGRGTFGVMVKQARLIDLVNYDGPDIFLDFDKDGRLIGLEILA